MITDVPGVPDIVARINEELPPEIRVWGYVRCSALSMAFLDTDFVLSRSVYKDRLMHACETPCIMMLIWCKLMHIPIVRVTVESTPTSSLPTS
jgi:hypothetical protein